jgi:hypothetical protein
MSRGGKRKGRVNRMGISDWGRATRKCLVTSVAQDEGNSYRLKLVVTRTQNSGVVVLAHEAVR